MDDKIKQLYLNISNYITRRLTFRVELTEDEQLILKYHLRCIICEMTRLIIMMIISAMMGVFLSFITAYTVMRLVRSTTGGLHHNSYLMCSLHSYLFFIVVLVLNVILDVSGMTLVFPVSVLVILIIGPAPSKERGIFGKKSRRRITIFAVISITCCWFVSIIMPDISNIIIITVAVVMIEFILKNIMLRLERREENAVIDM